MKLRHRLLLYTHGFEHVFEAGCRKLVVLSPEFHVGLKIVRDVAGKSEFLVTVWGLFARANTNNHPKIMLVILCLFIGTGGKLKTSFAVIYTWP